MTYSSLVPLLVLILIAKTNAFLSITGFCTEREQLNGVWTPAGQTASNHPYYTLSANTTSYFLFYDPDCRGDGQTEAQWIFDSTEPSTTALFDLDEDGSCSYYGYRAEDLGEATDPAPPLGTKSWRIFCGGEDTEDVSISIAFTSPPPSCPPGSSPSASALDTCDECWPGLTSASTDSDRCTPCPEDSYASSNSTCARCQSFTYSPPGSESVGDCSWLPHDAWEFTPGMGFFPNVVSIIVGVLSIPISCGGIYLYYAAFAWVVERHEPLKRFFEACWSRCPEGNPGLMGVLYFVLFVLVYCFYCVLFWPLILSVILALCCLLALFECVLLACEGVLKCCKVGGDKVRPIN
jgi:hypothetical protein